MYAVCGLVMDNSGSFFLHLKDSSGRVKDYLLLNGDSKECGQAAIQG